MIFLIAGAKRSGKDYTAKLLQNMLGDAEILHFASPMKRILSKTLGITEDELETLKNNDPAFRGYLQRFGTEAMKPEFGDSVWADLAYNKADKSKHKHQIIPDFRFPVEYMEGVVTIKIVNPNVQQDETSTHSSEIALEGFNFDYVIHNDGNGSAYIERRLFSIIERFKDESNSSRLKDSCIRYFSNPK